MVSGEREQAEADPESNKSGGKVLPEPLTRRGYRRRRLVEQRITDALALESADFLELVARRDETAPDYFPPEALAYFIRRAHRAGNKRLVNTLMRELYFRCRPFLHNRVRSFDGESRKEMIQEILTRLATDLLDPGDKGDFVEASFWSYLKARAIDVCRERMDELENPEVSLDAPVFDEEGDETESALSQVSDYVLTPEQMLLLKVGLAHLTPRLRQVFIMAHALEMKIESKDPNEKTISRHFGVTEKTVRNWLKEAERLLAPFREDRND